jgi:predicted  nucleic acid-binding Zn-ribbon protein
MTSAGQEALLALQDLDSTIDRLRHRRSSLPQRQELAVVHRQLDEARRAHRGAVERVEGLAGRQAHAEAELASAEARAADVDRRVAAGEAVTGRDISAITATQDHLRARISDLEDHVLAVLDERAPADHDLAAAEAEVERLQQLRAVLEGVIAGEEQAIDGETALLGANRPSLAAAVPGELLSAYDRLRPRLGGVAAARLIGDRCDGCHLTLPATEVDRIKRLPADAVAYCDQCGRILIRP